MMASTIPAPQRTLIDTAFPGRGLAAHAALMLGGSALVALSARVTIPLPWVPLTGQTYAVLLVSALLGGRRGALALLAYLAEGLAGLPVFADGHSAWTLSSAGVPTIIGPTAGYLFSYPVVGFVVGSLAARGWDRTVRRAIVTMVIGETLIYLGGVPWLAHFVGAAQAVQVGVLPFIAGDTVKLLLAAATLPLGWRLLGTEREVYHAHPHPWVR